MPSPRHSGIYPNPVSGTGQALVIPAKSLPRTGIGAGIHLGDLVILCPVIARSPLATVAILLLNPPFPKGENKLLPFVKGE